MSELYWHIGATQTRLRNVVPRSVSGEKRRLMRGSPDMSSGRRGLASSPPYPRAHEPHGEGVGRAAVRGPSEDLERDLGERRREDAVQLVQLLLAETDLQRGAVLDHVRPG